jgi:hypothetical protein
MSATWEFHLMLMARGEWPDSVDTLLVAAFLCSIGAIVIAGYVFMVLDYRAYLRSLRRALVCVANYLPHLPEWARAETPRCIAALGLRVPCSEADLLKAYRERVKHLHPDRGGDRKRFLALQQNFEEALSLLAARGNQPPA